MNAGCLVYVSVTYTPASNIGVNIMYDTKQYDPGNNFNMTTSEYHAPVTGYYLVASHLLSDDKVGDQIICVNGVEVIKDHMYDNQEDMVVTEPTIVLHLNASDLLHIQNYFDYGAPKVMGLDVDGRMQTWLSVALLHSE